MAKRKMAKKSRKNKNRIKEKYKKFKRRYMPRAKKFLNINLGLVFFLILIGSAFAISPLFGGAFVVAFALAIYRGDLSKKPWKPIAIFIGALLVRLALDQYLDPVLASETVMDLSVSALIFFAMLVVGWKIKRS